MFRFNWMKKKGFTRMDNYKEFRKVFMAIKSIRRFKTLKETDMYAGYLVGITDSLHINKSITTGQRNTLIEMIGAVHEEHCNLLVADDEAQEPDQTDEAKK